MTAIRFYQEHPNIMLVYIYENKQRFYNSMNFDYKVILDEDQKKLIDLKQFIESYDHKFFFKVQVTGEPIEKYKLFNSFKFKLTCISNFSL
jgi:hypothetical protein